MITLEVKKSIKCPWTEIQHEATIIALWSLQISCVENTIDIIFMRSSLIIHETSSIDGTNGDQIHIGSNNIVGDEEQAGVKNIANTLEQSNNIHEAENDVVSNERYKLRRKRGRKSTKKINEGESKSSAINKTLK